MKTKNEITRNRILEFIIQYKREHEGASPSFREICAGCYLASVSTVKYHLEELERTGRIERDEDNPNRNIRVPGGEWVYRGQP